MSRNRLLGALVQGVVAVTALGTPVLAGTAALGGGGGAGAHGNVTTVAAPDLATENSGITAAYAATNGAPQAPVKPTGDRALDAISSGAVKVGADTAGRVHYVSTPAGKPLKAPSSAGSTPASQARAQLNDFAKVFGVKSGSAFKTTETLAAGKRHVVRFQQTVGGAPVIGGEIAVTVDGNGGLVAINGEAGNVTGVSATAEVSAATAKARAIAATARSAKADAGSLVASDPELSVYDPTLVGPNDRLGTRPVWRVEVTSPGQPSIDQYVLIDAHTGGVALSFSQVEQAKDRSVCDFHSVPTSNPKCVPGSSQVARAEGDAATGITDVDDAYDLTGAVHDFYVSLGRDGIDDQSLPLISTVNFCPLDPRPSTPQNELCPYQNAFWNGTQMTFGSGYASADDVVGHELTHGVTQYTSNLLYYYQSGAINESMSDVMGELFDQSSHAGPAGTDTPATKWLIGEDLPGGGAIRSMSDPGQFGDPDSMSSPNWNPDFSDNGGVHFNSGVGNKAAFLMTDGGSLNGTTVTGIGDITKVARIWLGADELLTSGANYADLANALVQSCQNLGFTTECTSVSQAVAATQMLQPPTAEPPIPQAAQCPALTSPVNLFKDDFNRAASISLGSNWAENDGTADGGNFVDDEAKPSTVAGNALLMLAPFQTADTLTVTTKNFITLPAGDSFLHFNHLDAFDFLPAGSKPQYFDQAYVEISTDDKTWVNLGTAPWTNGPVADADGGPLSFGGDSRGWTSSRAGLKAYAGKKVKLRFRLTTDNEAPLSSGYGWWLDNISVYTCSGTNALTTDFNGDGWGDVAVGSPNHDVNGQTYGGSVVITYGGPGGLSDIDSQVINTGDVGLPAGFTNLRFGTSVVTGDFNYDTFTDLAIGAPGNNSSQGFVTVLYGSYAGITLNGGQNWGGATFVSSGYADAGRALAAGDFNGDSYVDLAIGVDGYSSGKGGVGVLKGSTVGLTTAGKQWFTQDSASVPGAGENNDHFGRSLAAGDFNGDKRADLAVGVPNEALGSLTNAGAVVVLPGASGGLTGTGSKAFSQDTAGVPGAAEKSDLFGSALAAGDVTKDGRADLAVGAPGEAIGSLGSAGMVHLLKGSSSGLTGTGSQAFSQNSAGLPGGSEAGDRFGGSVALGDLTGDGFGDLVVGTPGEAIGTLANAGWIELLRGTASGLTGTGSTAFHQDSANVPDASEAGDLWGAAVRIVLIQPGTRLDLIIGAPGENSSAGAVTVLHGASTGATATGSRLFTGAVFAGGAEAGANFGASIG